MSRSKKKKTSASSGAMNVRPNEMTAWVISDRELGKLFSVKIVQLYVPGKYLNVTLRLTYISQIC